MQQADSEGQKRNNGSETGRRLQQARERADSYEESDLDRTQSDEDEQAHSTEEWSDIVSQRIEDAMRQGLFDNLSNRGKPVNVNRNPFLPEEQQMAVNLLHNNGLAPEWISDRNDILREIETLRHDLRQDVLDMRAVSADATTVGEHQKVKSWWKAQVKRWQTKCDKLNDHILVHNLKLPVPHLEILRLQLSRELGRAGADPAWLDD